jgi:hypothetical protein
MRVLWTGFFTGAGVCGLPVEEVVSWFCADEEGEKQRPAATKAEKRKAENGQRREGMTALQEFWSE